ncbi:MAG TPA: VOC family protein [Hyphomicrobiales bacterium]|nr:VOC family protein [Hyphomicrobiales bacterium]
MSQADTATRPAADSPVRLRFSHVGFFVRDLPKMLDFYTRALGFTVTDRGRVNGNDIVFTSWDPREHHQVVLVAGREGDLRLNHINQMSFRVDSVEDLQAVWRRVKDEPEIRDLRPVNHGNAWSIYFRDPEGNRIEIFCDTEWYIEQPCIEELDLSLPADEIRRRSDAFCRTAPGFKPVAEFQAELAGRIERRG